MTPEKDLLEKRARLVGQLEDLDKNVQGRAVTDEESAQWDKIDADITSLTQEIERGRKVKERKALLAEQADLHERGGRARLADEQMQEAKPEYRKVFDKYLRKGVSGLNSQERSLLMEKRGTNPQGAASGSIGGFTVPEEFGDELIKSMTYYGGVLGDASVIRTASGAAMPFPTLDETSVKGVLVAENASIAVNDMTFGQTTLNAYMYSSGIVLMSLQLLQDEGVNLESELLPIFAERLGKITNEHLTTGDGSGKPTGFLTTAGSAVTAAATNAITRSEIVDLVHGVDRAYRNNAKFHLNDSTLAAIRKLALGSADARPLWQPSIREGEPDRLEGFAYTVNNDMPALGAGNEAIAFGDFSKLRVRLVSDMTMVTFDEKYMDQLQKGFMSYLRMDGKLLDTKAIKTLTCAAV